MPPFIPKIDGNYGLHNFDKEFTEISLVSPDINSNKKFKNFENFTWEDSKMVAENPNDKEQFYDYGKKEVQGVYAGSSSGKINFDPIKEEDNDAKMYEE